MCGGLGGWKKGRVDVPGVIVIIAEDVERDTRYGDHQVYGSRVGETDKVEVRIRGSEGNQGTGGVIC